MVITTILAFFLMVKRWHWQVVSAGALAGLFLSFDIPFFGANLLKITHGGWFPLAAGMAVFTLMMTWRRGRELLSERLQGGEEPLEDFIDKLAAESASPGARNGSLHDRTTQREPHRCSITT